jgi:hypothetical protein
MGYTHLIGSENPMIFTWRQPKRLKNQNRSFKLVSSMSAPPLKTQCYSEKESSYLLFSQKDYCSAEHTLVGDISRAIFPLFFSFLKKCVFRGLMSRLILLAQVCLSIKGQGEGFEPLPEWRCHPQIPISF